MKRDMDLVREILFLLEQKVDPQDWLRPKNVEDYTPDQVGYHIKLMHEAGLVTAIDISSMSDPIAWVATHATWEGHEFLEAARNDSI